MSRECWLWYINSFIHPFYVDHVVFVNQPLLSSFFGVLPVRWEDMTLNVNEGAACLTLDLRFASVKCYDLVHNSDVDLCEKNIHGPSTNNSWFCPWIFMKTHEHVHGMSYGFIQYSSGIPYFALQKTLQWSHDFIRWCYHMLSRVCELFTRSRSTSLQDRYPQSKYDRALDMQQIYSSMALEEPTFSMPCVHVGRYAYTPSCGRFIGLICPYRKDIKLVVFALIYLYNCYSPHVLICFLRDVTVII